MPLFIPLIIVVIALMYYRFKTSRLSRDCRWRQDRARGIYVCAFCGAEVASENGKAPNICLRDSSKTG